MDGEGGQGAGASEATGGDGGQGGGGGGGSAQAGAWRDSLPDDLKGDATLAKYDNLEALARGHLETKRLASSKLNLPGADADAEAWNPVWDALGRPKDAESYTLAPPDPGEGATEADKAAAAAAFEVEVKPYRDLAHKLGLNDAQAGGLLKFEQDRMAAAVKAYQEKGAAEVTEVKGAIGGDYETKLAAGQKVFEQIFGKDKFAAADRLDELLGSGALVKGVLKLGELAGEHGRIGGEGGGFGADVANARQQLDRLLDDQSWREKLNKGDVTVKAQYDKLLKAAQAQAVAGGGH